MGESCLFGGTSETDKRAQSRKDPYYAQLRKNKFALLGERCGSCRNHHERRKGRSGRFFNLVSFSWNQDMASGLMGFHIWFINSSQLSLSFTILSFNSFFELTLIPDFNFYFAASNLRSLIAQLYSAFEFAHYFIKFYFRKDGTRTCHATSEANLKCPQKVSNSLRQLIFRLYDFMNLVSNILLAHSSKDMLNGLEL